LKSLREAIETIHSRHSEYIEATYHIRHPRLIKERKGILSQPGNVVTLPWIEATPAYKTGDWIEDMGLPPPVKDLLLKYNSENLGVYNPLYRHQAEALKEFFNQGKDLVVSTGTGSGKTEIFIYSILGMLALEGARGRSPLQRGMRAIILYPMNALVSDQLSRLRRTIGGERPAEILKEMFGRTVQFGMYTSRTPYHGTYNPDKNDRRVKPAIGYFAKLASDPKKVALFRELNDRGRIPAKNLVGFASGPRDSRYKTQPGDRELFTRQEMHSPNEYGGTPDVLITNYSMLEYMLLRPIEQPLFETTRKWLDMDPENQLILVIDEAHLYRGAQGAEVAMLISRLIQHLGIGRDRVRCILTSATLGSPESALKNGRGFASKLTAGKEDDFSVILGTRRELGGKPPLPTALGRALLSVSSDLKPTSLTDLANYFGWKLPLPSDGEELRIFLGQKLIDTEEFKTLHDVLAERPPTVDDAGKRLVPKLSKDEQIAAVLNFALVATAARLERSGAGVTDSPLLPVRLHLMYRGLPPQYVCVNSECSGRRADEDAHMLGTIFLAPMLSCPHCGSRVFELLTHRTCGAAYLKAFVDPRSSRFPRFLWGSDESGDLQEVHLLMEEPRRDPDPSGSNVPLFDIISPKYIDKKTGYLLDSLPHEDPSRYVQCWWPPGEDGTPALNRKRKKRSKPTLDENSAWSWPRCYACGIRGERRWKGSTKIMDLETKGEDPFANIVKTLFYIQPPAKAVTEELARRLPNKGKKVLCFSDGRQKAARLARDLQRTVENDSFRELLVLAAANAGDDKPLDTLFAHMVIVTKNHNICLFDDGDGREGGGDYDGSRFMFLTAQKHVSRIIKDFDLRDEMELLEDKGARRELDGMKPRQYNQKLLRTLGDPNFSVKAALIGYVAPLSGTLQRIQSLNESLEPGLVRSIVLAVIENALELRALDPRISEEDRRISRRTITMPRGWSDGEGLTLVTIIPEKKMKKPLKEHFHITDDQISRLVASMRRGGLQGEEPLFVMEKGRLWLNPAAVTLKVAFSEDWEQCRGCGRFNAYSYDGKCPDFECLGEMVPVSSSDLYTQTRKSYLRKPISEILEKKREPFTLRSEEHTAQLTAKDITAVFGRAEKYELLFQDVLVDDLEDEQPIDVLSCTTTMEVGIDIGSLTAVALRTVPPRPDNYQQRSGRAGRRGSALSVTVTFADNSPYETFIFQNPHKIVGADPGTPTIYVQNTKIAERHINASLIQAFFQRPTGAVGSSAAEDAKAWNVFESLGTSHSFFVEKGPYSLEEFEKWVSSEIIQNSHGLADKLESFFPPELASNLQYGSEPDWRRRFITETSTRFVEALKKKRDVGNWSKEPDEDDNLLSNLLDAALLPTFSFPIDLCAFVVRDKDKKRGRVVNRYEMTQDLAQALSEYVPGREIVVDKHTFISYGLYFPMTNDFVNRARVVPWDSLPWLNFCKCGAIIDNDKEPLSAKKAKCKVCDRYTIESIPRFRPEGFAPRVRQTFGKQPGAFEGGKQASERVYATRASFPVPVMPAPPKGETEGQISKVAEIRKLPNQKLLIANYGPDSGGFTVCRDCGAVSLTGDMPTPHVRPYQIDVWQMKGQKRQCSGSSVQVAFAFDFQTDLAILSVTARSPLNFAPYANWFRGAALSLTEALVLGATRALNIQSSELAGNWRVVPKYEGDPPEVKGHFEFYLYDTTPGGAGFAAMAAADFPKVIEEARSILEGCDCGASCHKCIRTYENRIHHRILNRFDALSLLKYALTGTVPPLKDEHAEELLSYVESALSLRDSSAVMNKREGSLQVSRNDKIIEVTVRPALRESESYLTPGTPGKKQETSSPLKMEFTDYDILHNLPMVVERILDAGR